jgi:hypothetical protein
LVPVVSRSMIASGRVRTMFLKTIGAPPSGKTNPADAPSHASTGQIVAEQRIRVSRGEGHAMGMSLAPISENRTCRIERRSDAESYRPRGERRSWAEGGEFYAMLAEHVQAPAETLTGMTELNPPQATELQPQW